MGSIIVTSGAPPELLPSQIVRGCLLISTAARLSSVPPHLSSPHGRVRFCRPGSAISIEGPRSLASASADIRAKSALTQFPRTTVERLRKQQVESGRGELFEELRPHLTQSGEERYADLAQRLGMTEEAVKMAIHRLRRRFRELLRIQIGETLASADDVDGELQYLLKVLRASAEAA